MSQTDYDHVEALVQEAGETVLSGREDTHGHIRDNFQQISEFWSSYLGTQVSPSDVAIMMVMLKISRQSVGSEEWDHYVDMIGYSAIAGALSPDALPDFETLKTGEEQ